MRRLFLLSILFLFILNSKILAETNTQEERITGSVIQIGLGLANLNHKNDVFPRSYQGTNDFFSLSIDSPMQTLNYSYYSLHGLVFLGGTDSYRLDAVSITGGLIFLPSLLTFKNYKWHLYSKIDAGIIIGKESVLTRENWHDRYVKNFGGLASNLHLGFRHHISRFVISTYAGHIAFYTNYQDNITTSFTHGFHFNVGLGLTL